MCHVAGVVAQVRLGSWNEPDEHGVGFWGYPL